MKNKIGKVTSLLVILCMLSVMLIGCGQSTKSGTPGSTQTPDTASQAPTQGTTQPEPKMTVRYVTPGSEPSDAAERFDAINKKLQQDGVNLELSFTFLPWDVWEQKVNLMLSTGEEFDVLTIMEDWIKSSVYAGRGAIVPIDEQLEKYPDLKAAFPDYVWEGGKIDNKIYTIPVFYREWANDYELLSVRTDLLNKYNLKPPTNQAELIAAAETIQKGETEQKLYVWLKYNTILHGIHREYATYPFNVVDDLFYIDQEGNVKAWMETEEFKKDHEFMRTLYSKGLIHPDILTLPLDQAAKYSTEGTFSFSIGNALSGWPIIHSVTPEAEIDTFRIAPEKPWMRPLLMNNDNAIPKTSKNPEAAVKFFDWLYKSQDNYDLLAYGVKDSQWKDLGANQLEYANPDPTIVRFDIWKIGYYKYNRYMPTDHPKFAESEKINDSAVNAINIGFTFNTEPVAVEYSNLLAEIKTSIYPLKLGVVDYDKYYPAALDKMKAAGLDKVVAEYQKQLKAWLDSKK